MLFQQPICGRGTAFPAGLSAALLVLLCVTAGALAAQEGGGIRSQCAALSRPAIDCGCVARRVERLRKALPAELDSAFLDEGYRAAAGAANRYGETLQRLFSDMQAAVRVELALDPLGGRPQSIDEYEEGCVLSGAAPAELPSWPREYATRAYVSGCVASTSQPRYCECAVARARGRVEGDAFEAYYRSFADYSDRGATTLAQMGEARARAMGITPEQYQELASGARRQIDAHAEQDAAYCAALLWADPLAGDPAEVVAERYRASAVPASDVRQRTQVPAATAASTSGSRYPKAMAIVSEGCAAAGRTSSACACLRNAVEREVFSAAASESVALAYALISYGEAMDPLQKVRTLAELSGDEQMAAAMLAGRTDPEAACE